MGYVVLKADRRDRRDAALFMVFSSVSDQVVKVGPAHDVYRWLLNQEIRRAKRQLNDSFGRALQTGTSDRSIRFGAWDDDSIAIRHGCPPPPAGVGHGAWRLDRSDMPAYARALRRGDRQAANALLTYHAYEDD